MSAISVLKKNGVHVQNSLLHQQEIPHMHLVLFWEYFGGLTKHSKNVVWANQTQLGVLECRVRMSDQTLGLWLSHQARKNSLVRIN